MINVSSLVLGELERIYISDVLNSARLTQGKYVAKLEEATSELLLSHTLSCSSGTSALHLALLSLGVTAKSAVIVPNLTYVATANAASYCGAHIYLVDVELATGCIDIELVDQLLNSISYKYDKVVVIVTHLYNSLSKLPTSLKCQYLIQDSCHAFGGLPPIDSTSYFNIRTYSFFSSKIIGCGEGGLIETDDETIKYLCSLYRGQGASVPGNYYHSVIGYNYRLTELQAAIALAQLETLSEKLKQRQGLFGQYFSLMPRGILTLPHNTSCWAKPVLFPTYGLKSRSAMYLKYNQVETRPFFIPLNRLPIYNQAPYITRSAEQGSISDILYKRGLLLPMHCDLTLENVEFICSLLTNVMDASCDYLT